MTILKAEIDKGTPRVNNSILDELKKYLTITNEIIPDAQAI